MQDTDETERVSHRTVNRFAAFGLKHFQVDVIGANGFSVDTTTYSFETLERAAEWADVVHGEPPETDGGETAIMYVSGPGRNYPVGHDIQDDVKLPTVPVDVLEKIRDSSLALYEGVGGGWESWDGRPEFSTSYVNLSGATRVDIDAVIEDRRAQN